MNSNNMTRVDYEANTLGIDKDIQELEVQDLVDHTAMVCDISNCGHIVRYVYRVRDKESGNIITNYLRCMRHTLRAVKESW